MKVQAEVSLYPLRTKDVGGVIAQFVRALRAQAITLEPGTMSTRISGEAKAVFAALQDAFAQVAEEHQIVLTAKVSNACPAPKRSQKPETQLP